MSEELENTDFETDGGVDITPVGTPSPVAETVEPLKEDYKDDILDYTINQNRRYRMVNHSDGTVSFEDVTQYTQIGDEFGAQEINQITGAVNALNSNLNHIEYGEGSIEVSKANTVYTVNIIFAKPYQSKPFVIVGATTSAPLKVSVGTMDCSTTGFVITMARTDTATTGYRWVAIGK